MSQKTPPTDNDTPSENKDDALGFETKSEKQADAGGSGVTRPRSFDGQHKQSSV